MGSKQKNRPLVIDFKSLYRGGWTETETQNVALVSDFVQNLMNNHDFDYVMQEFNNSAYVQHNSSIPDGMSGLVDFLRSFVKRYPEYGYDVKRIVADGDLVMFHSHATLKEKHRGDERKGMIIIDYWRLKDGQITEHWDSIQTIPFGLTFFLNFLKLSGRKNNNGLFQ
ncbi:MAG: nuclear transport factor 2 family protein [Planctomycetota bacterium]